MNESTLKSLKGEFCIWFFCKIQMIFCHNEFFSYTSRNVSCSEDSTQKSNKALYKKAKADTKPALLNATFSTS